MNTRAALFALLLGTLGGCTAVSKMGQVMLDPSVPIGAPGQQLSHFSLSLYASPTLNLNPSSTLPPALETREAVGAPMAVNVSAANPIELTDRLQVLLDELREEYPARSAVQFDRPPAPAMSSVSEVGSYRDESVHMTFNPRPLAPHQVTTPIAFQVLQLKDDSMLLTASYEALAQNLAKALGSTLLQVDDYRLMPGQFKFVEPEEIHPATRYLAVIAHYHDRDDSDWKRVLAVAQRGRRHALLVQFEENGVVLKDQG